MVLSRPTRRGRIAGAREIGGRDESYRLLAIGILALAHDDYTKGKTHAQHDALHFIMSEWSEDICDGVGIDVDAYRAECKKKWESERLKIKETAKQGGIKLKLYELALNYRQLWEMVDNDESDLQSIEDTLQCVEGAIEEKVSNIAMFFKNLDADVDAIDNEVKRLQDRKKAIVAKGQWLKTYIQTSMETAGLDKVKTPTMTIAIQNNPPAVLIEPEAVIPAKYMTIIPETSQVNKKALSDALKAGEIIPGAKLTQGRSLRIR